MAAGWSVLDALNKNSRAAAENTPKARFRTRDISVAKIYSNDKNFYSMQDIEELADLILAVGLIENIAVTYAPCELGEYRIISGEKRYRALNHLIESGHTEFEIVTCQILTPAEECEEMVQLIIANSYRTKTVGDQLEEAKRLKESLQYMRDHDLTLQGAKLSGTKLRDVVAGIMRLSATKIAQIDGINANLIPEFIEQLKDGKLTFSAAYELSGMPREEQEELLAAHEGGDAPTWKEVKDAKRQETEQEPDPDNLPGQMEFPRDFEDGAADEPGNEDAAENGRVSDSDTQAEQPEPGREDDATWQQAHPDSITSLCYSCKRYADCNVKTSTCERCDRYVKKAEAEKTPEQRYDEEQAAIDRETARKLQEMDREEKLSKLPSEAEEPISVSLSVTEYTDIIAGRKFYLILKNTKIKHGMIVTAVEMSEGKQTGRTMELAIVGVDDASTSSALVDGYCVAGVQKI